MKSMYERCNEVMPAVANRATTLGIVDSEGCYLETEDGRKVLDFASGVAVNNLGNKNQRVVEAIKKQLDTMIHVGHNVVYYESYVNEYESWYKEQCRPAAELLKKRIDQDYEKKKGVIDWETRQKANRKWMEGMY